MSYHSLSRRVLLQRFSVLSLGGLSGMVAGCGSGTASEGSTSFVPTPEPVPVVNGPGTFRLISHTAPFYMPELGRDVIPGNGTITNAGDLVFLSAPPLDPPEYEGSNPPLNNPNVVRIMSGNKASAGDMLVDTNWAIHGESPFTGAVYSTLIDGKMIAYDPNGRKTSEKLMWPEPGPSSLSHGICFASNGDLIIFPHRSYQSTVATQNYDLYRISLSLELVSLTSLSDLIISVFPPRDHEDTPYYLKQLYTYCYTVHQDRFYLFVVPFSNDKSDHRILVTDLSGNLQNDLRLTGNSFTEQDKYRRVSDIAIDRAGNFFVLERIGLAETNYEETRIHHHTPGGIWRSTLVRPASSICCDPRYANRVALFSENGVELYEVV